MVVPFVAFVVAAVLAALDAAGDATFGPHKLSWSLFFLAIGWALWCIPPVANWPRRGGGA